MIQRIGWGLLIALGLGLTCGCKRTPAVDAKVVEAAAKQPGAAEVMAAIDKKDFDGVLTAIAKVQAQVTTDEQQVQFMLLARQARDKISEVAPNDPKAMEVVAALRALVTGGR
jgi:hypothetical protein